MHPYKVLKLFTMAITLRVPLRLIVFPLSVLLSMPLAFAQQNTGIIKGRVLQEETGQYLEGATVELSPRTEHQLTTFEGEFAFYDLPPGKYTIRVIYSGLDPQTASIELSAGTIVDRTVTMSTDAYKMEKFVVTGEREGNAAAIVAQKNAPNVINNIAIDAFGPIADGNIARFLQHLPGVDNAGLINGEVGSFGVRGMEQALSTVTMDGDALATANAAGTYGDRAFPIDIVPAEMIESVRLTKSPTPDMAADSIGGNVNLKTKSALNLKGRRLNYSAGGNYNTYRGNAKWRPTASFSYIDRLGEDNSWGITVVGSYSSAYDTQDRLVTALHHVDTDKGDLNVEDPVIKTQLRFLTADTQRDRMGGSVKIEKKLGYNLVLNGSIVYNLFKSKMDRSDPRITGVNRVVMYEGADKNGNPMNSEAAIRTGADAYTINADNVRQRASIAPGYTETYQEWLDTTVQNYVWLTKKRTDLWRYMAGAEYKYSRGWARLAAAYSQSESNYERYTFYGQQARGMGLIIDADSGSPERPKVTESYNARNGTIFEGSDVDNYSSGRFSSVPQDVTDEVFSATLDWNHRFSRSAFVHYVQTGLAYRTKDYSIIENTYSYDYKVASGFSQFLRDKPSEALFNGYYPSFDYFDIDKIRRALGEDRSSFTFRNNVYLPASFFAENVLSAYAMTGRAMGRFSWLAGVRMEYTDLKGEGNVSSQNKAGQIAYARLSKKSDFTDYFPGVHLRYDLTSNIVLRASWSRSMGRPSISRQVPSTEIYEGSDPDDDTSSTKGTIRENNISLKPMYSDNFDIMFEWYFSKAGIFSAGVFERRIDGYIMNVKDMITANNTHGWGPEYYDYTYRTQVNMNNAKVKGVEFDYNQALSFLPAALRTMRLNANATLMETSGSFDGGSTELPGFKKRLFNVGITWPIRKFQVRVFYNYNGPYLSSYNTLDIDHTYKTGVRVLNANFQYQINRRFIIFADLFNILNDAPNDYVINPSHIEVYEQNGMRMSVGIKGRF